MIKKIQVLVREVYESEVFETAIIHNETKEEIDKYDYKNLPEEKQKEYTYTQVSTGKSKIEERDGDPLFGQIFSQEAIDVRDLILHLNRTR